MVGLTSSSFIKGTTFSDKLNEAENETKSGQNIQPDYFRQIIVFTFRFGIKQ
jgi:hypothetical protein